MLEGGCYRELIVRGSFLFTRDYVSNIKVQYQYIYYILKQFLFLLMLRSTSLCFSSSPILSPTLSLSSSVILPPPQSLPPLIILPPSVISPSSQSLSPSLILSTLQSLSSSSLLSLSQYLCLRQ